MITLQYNGDLPRVRLDAIMRLDEQILFLTIKKETTEE